MKTLERRLGLYAIIGISIGAMLGSGLFVLPGLAVAMTGPSVWLAYVVAGICVLPAALSKAELATAMPVSGGTYVYIDRTFGPLMSTIGGVGLWFSLLLKSAFALVGFGAYLSVLTDAPQKPVGLVLLAAIATLNIVGVRKVGKAQVWVVLISLISLVLLSLWGAVVGSPPSGERYFGDGTLGFFATVSFVYVSYAGVTKVAAVAEEVRDPGRNLPIGILLSLGLVTALYGTVTWVMTANVPLEQLAGDLRPVHSLAEASAGPVVGWFAAVLGVLTMTSMANAGLLASSRFPFAMGRDDLLPSVLGRVSPRFTTPVPAILLTAGAMAAAILFLDVASIAKYASALVILGFLLVNLSVIVLRETQTQWYQPSFRSPLYPVVQVVGVLVCLLLLVALGTSGLLATLVTFVLGFATFTFFGRQRTDRRGVLGRLGPRREQLAEPALEEAELPAEAAAVVALVGAERSPESLVEIGQALAGGASVEVVHFTQIPEQLSLQDVDQENPLIDSLRRRIGVMAEERSEKIEFEALITRDPERRIHDISKRVECDWVIVEWRDRIKGSLLSFSPRGWLVEHLSCNLAEFKDAGIRRMREILVLAEPGPHDALVASTADALAGVLDAKLTFVRFVPDEASSMAMQAEVDYVEELSKLCQTEPACRVVRGKDEVRAVTGITAGYDLLVLGAPRRARWRDYFRGTVAERITRLAGCSVLRLKTPRMRAHAAAAAPPPSASSTEVRVSDFLVGSCLNARLQLSNKDALFAHFASSFAEAIPDVQAPDIEAALWAREATQNTAVDRGMALPHATIRDLERTYLGVFTTAGPIDYKAPDQKPVDVFFVTLGPPSARDTHLRILAGLSNLVLATPLLEDLRSASGADELRRAFEASRAAVAVG